jgi:hypothetical protein
MQFEKCEQAELVWARRPDQIEQQERPQPKDTGLPKLKRDVLEGFGSDFR